MQTYMIGFTVSRNGREAEIRCPCKESDISRVQDKLEIPYETDTRVKVIGVDSDIEQLSVLEGQETDLDYLNLLARIMDGMDSHEYEQFRMGLYHESFTDLKSIVNVAMTPNRYSIIDPDDLHGSGLDHEFDLRGGIPKSEVDITDYSIIGRQLVDSGKCEKTPYGLLYVNEEIPVDDFFDGLHMPPYFDCQFQAAVSLHNDTDADFIFLPCTDAELQRSAKRLGTSFPYDLKVKIEDTPLHTNDLVYGLMKKADVYTLNQFARLVDRFDEDKKEKFLAILDYVNRTFRDIGGLGSLDAATKIGGILHAFTFYPNALSDYELGHSVINERVFDEDLEEYLDFDRYGGDIRKKENGIFTDDGYIGLNDGNALRQALTQNNDQGMGGIT